MSYFHIEALVHHHMSSLDGSHDWEHVKRVCRLAMTIAQNEGLEVDPEIVYLSALVHDVNDHKYPEQHIDLKPYLPESKADKILEIASSLSFSKGKTLPYPEFKIVQDADRLDAIGSIGVARCMIFTGTKKGSMASAIQHFSDKLLKLKDLLHTETAKKLAEKRHQRLLNFLDDFEEEEMRYAYRLMSIPDWDLFREMGEFFGGDHDRKDGYIHMSPKSEIERTRAKYFGSSPHVVLQIDLEHPSIAGKVKWEKVSSRNGEFFAHLNGILPIEAVNVSL